MKLRVIKRDGKTIVNYDKERIYNAILKAMAGAKRDGKGEINPNVALSISNKITDILISNNDTQITVFKIEELVYEQLCANNLIYVAREYETVRSIQYFKRMENTTDESILSLIGLSNEEVMRENSNKDGYLASTQRDLIAGEVSKDITRRKKLPLSIVKAHDEGAIHFHDMDYFIQSIFNCCLIDLEDMLMNGTVINKRLIESPHSFKVAATVTTQIIAQVASNQYGGQSISIKHLAPFVQRSRDRYYKILGDSATPEIVEKLTIKEVQDGIQTMQYQINTLLTTNGQSPFVTFFLDLGEEGDADTALIIEEIIRQRLQGLKNEAGVYTTPAFPKLVYVLYEHNCLEGGKYDYITELSAQCNIKRLYPDYISSKRMKEIYEGNVFSPMGCRSFLSPWKDKDGNFKFEGRFNMGVCSVNVPQVAILSGRNENKFWELFESRLELCFEALMLRYESLKGTISDVSPIHWQYGAIARLKSGEVIDELLKDGYATISLGYIGIYEAVKYMTGESHTTEKGTEFALRIMKFMKEHCDRWKSVTGLGFGLYGTPAESLCYRFAKIDKSRFGDIEDITDKGYYTNSYHVDVRENIDAFAKLKFESQFQPISSGGCISYIEMANMSKNPDAVKTLINFIYHNIQYAEFNTKSDNCLECGFEGEVLINDDLEWECPVCHNKNPKRLNVIRRTCGYLGENMWNIGKTKEIKQRVLHI